MLRHAGRALGSASRLYRAMGLWLMLSTAMGRDLGSRYANSPLKPWFDQLKSRNGPCCSNADGYVV